MTASSTHCCRPVMSGHSRITTSQCTAASEVNTPDGIRTATLDGLGIAYAPVGLFEDALLDGRLQLLLEDYPGPPTPIQLIYPERRLLSQRAKVFMDFVAEEFAHEAVLNEGAVAQLRRRKRRWLE